MHYGTNRFFCSAKQVYPYTGPVTDVRERKREREEKKNVTEIMIHIDGRNVLVMDSSTDRVRLKDKITTNISKAIKSVCVAVAFIYLLL